MPRFVVAKTMDKLYSKQILILKAVCCLLLAPLYALISRLLTIEDGFVYILASIVPVICIYCIPFWISLTYINKYRVSTVWKYISWDAVICLAPSIFGTLFYEIIFTVVNGRSISDGFVTLIFSTIYIIISFVFWILYFIFSYKKKNRS